MTKHDDDLMARASEALSMEPDEILSVQETDDGLVAITKDNNAMVINDELDPPVQFLIPPRADYKGSFPVLHPERDPRTDPTDLAVAPAIDDSPTPEVDPAGHGQNANPAGDQGNGGGLPDLPAGVDLGASVAEVVKAVGDDKDAAAAVLAHENAAEAPRKTLVAQLEELTGAGGD